eukprot:c47591_g1_i1 orf=386-1006(-)
MAEEVEQLQHHDHGEQDQQRQEDAHILHILWSSAQIEHRVSQLGLCISHDFAELPQPLVVIGVATGAFVFLADLVRRITIPVVVDFVRAQSYGNRTESSGVAEISGDVKVDVKGVHVLVVEDIIDTGITLSHLIPYFTAKGAASVSVCAFLDKVSRRVVPLELPHNGKFYRGFECPNSFVVGYGLDFAGRYRSLPYIGLLKPSLYQ